MRDSEIRLNHTNIKHHLIFVPEEMTTIVVIIIIVLNKHQIKLQAAQMILCFNPYKHLFLLYNIKA